MTTSDLQRLLIRTLQFHIDNPVVLVEILEKYTVSVQILGQVRNPGLHEIPSQLDVQSAITLAGGLNDDADPSRIHVIRHTEKGTEKISCSLIEFMQTGEFEKLPELKEGDIVVIPGLIEDSYVIVMGSVQRPGNFFPYPGSDLLQALLNAGGVTPSADSRRIRLLKRLEDGHYETTTINLEKILDRSDIDQIPLVNGGDIIIVPQRGGFLDWDNTMLFIRNISIIISLVVLIQRVQL